MAKVLQSYPDKPTAQDHEALEQIARALARPDDAARAAAAKAAAASPLMLDEAGAAALLDAMPAALGLLSEGLLLHANPAFVNAFGYRAFDELASAGGLDAIAPAGLEGAETVMRAGAKGSSQIQLDAISRGQRQLKVNFEISPLAGDRPLHVLRIVDLSPVGTMPQPGTGLAPDLAPTRPVSSERQLSFLAKISHEVRTPLNSILGFTELMIGERLGPIGNERYRGYIEDIRQSGLYALSLLNDLLDLSKIEAGKFELDFAAVEIGEMVEDCVHVLQPLAKRERILLRVSLEPDLPAAIADARRLKQILLNLLSNAIKFTREGGQVIVSAQRVADGGLRLRVHDNGIGMAADEIKLAMQPFQQLDTAPRKQTGTGLGLPLTKALIEASRARFILSSQAGVGTSADVIFPKDRLAQEKTASPS